MAAGFAYFTSADSGAPVLSGSVGAMIRLLDWVLVSKGGWDKAFTGTNLAAYRSQSGNRFYLRVDDTQATYSRMRGYRAMTAISSGTNPFPNTTQAPSATWGWVKSVVADSTPIRYWGVRTNRYLLIVIEHSNITTGGISYRSIVTFGDFPSYGETDPYNTLLNGIDVVNYSSNPLFSYYFSSGMQFSPTSSVPATGVFTSLAATFSGTATPNCGIIAPFGFISSGYDPNWYATNRLVTSPFQLLNSSNSTNTSNLVPRGRLPNIQQVYGCMPLTSLAGYPTYDGEVFTQNDRSYIAITSTANSPGNYDCILLETSDTDGAL